MGKRVCWLSLSLSDRDFVPMTASEYEPSDTSASEEINSDQEEEPMETEPEPLPEPSTVGGSSNSLSWRTSSLVWERHHCLACRMWCPGLDSSASTDPEQKHEYSCWAQPLSVDREKRFSTVSRCHLGDCLQHHCKGC
ncbi:UNVERIFIED_CONTAM: hypothetical protein FKN15_031288 [Acipenser sinensis]